MKLPFLTHYLSYRAFISLVVLITLAACSGQPAAKSLSPTAAAQPTATALVPNTGAATAAPTLPALPTLSATTTTQPTAPAQPTTASQPTAPPQPTAASTTAAASAPSCTAPAAVTPAVTEGPYFKAGSPETANLLKAGIPGTKLVLSGYVLTSTCQSVAHALLDFWQADGQGVYDNSGYTLRGHQYTDANGHYQLETVIPGLYPGRTEHIHVKVQAPGGPILTSQLFFPGVSNNSSDGIFTAKLLVSLSDAPDGKLAAFNFVIAQP